MEIRTPLILFNAAASLSPFYHFCTHMSDLKLIECPRDAMQGIDTFIETEQKVEYINQLLKVGFHTIDFGSFVSPKAIPQMADTAEVLSRLDLTESNSKLLAIVANERGAMDACNHEQIDFLGFPFSISEEFQKRNTNSGIDESLQRVESIQKLCQFNGKKLVVYISMAFGNPYGEKWHPDIAAHWSSRLADELEVGILALSDTTGVSSPENIEPLFSTLTAELSGIEIGAHFHTTPEKWKEKIDSAYKSGCRRFDGAIMGFGGCPMAEKVIDYFDEAGIDLGIKKQELDKSLAIASRILNQ
jgi:hydroxymethylglutaryl-CoA lyase